MVKVSPPKPVKALITYPTRALNTIYQNLTGRPLLVIISCRCLRANVASASATFTAACDASTPPTTGVCTAGCTLEDNNPEDAYFTLAFAITPGYYYTVSSVVAGDGSYVTLLYWCEVEL